MAYLYLVLNGNVDSLKTKAATKVSKEVKKAVTTYKETPGLGKLNMSTIKKAVELAKKQRQQI